MRVLRALIATIVVAAQMSGPVRAATSVVRFHVFAHTNIRLADIVWTGSQFLYIENTTNHMFAASPTGMPVAPFAAMPKVVEETRCRPAPAGNGFTAGELFCHAPDNTIYRISADGKKVALFARLPDRAKSDGALTFDTGGAFGNALLVATGRSGGGKLRGGRVFAISAQGTVRLIGTYNNPGGADEMVMAPPSFGGVAGQALLAVDAGKSGALVAMDAHGAARTLVSMSDGLNPIVVVTQSTVPRGGAQPGLYVTDTLSRNVYFAPASDIDAFAGTVLAGSELRGLFWVVRANGNHVTATAVRTNLPGKGFNFEGATYIAP